MCLLSPSGIGEEELHTPGTEDQSISDPIFTAAGFSCMSWTTFKVYPYLSDLSPIKLNLGRCIESLRCYKSLLDETQNRSRSAPPSVRGGVTLHASLISVHGGSRTTMYGPQTHLIEFRHTAEFRKWPSEHTQCHWIFCVCVCVSLSVCVSCLAFLYSWCSLSYFPVVL